MKTILDSKLKEAAIKFALESLATIRSEVPSIAELRKEQQLKNLLELAYINGAIDERIRARYREATKT
mgnify:CR=1 FL=1